MDSARKSGRFAASRAHHLGRVRGDRRGFRVQPSVPARAVCRDGVVEPDDRDRRLLRPGRGRAGLAPAVPEAQGRSRRAGRTPVIAANEQQRTGESGLRSRRGRRPGPRANRAGRGAGAAVARRRRPVRGCWPGSPRRASITSITEASSGSDGAGASIPTRDAARSSRRRIGHQSPTSAVAAPSAQPLRSDRGQGFERMPRGDQAGFGFGRAGRARHRSDRGSQPNEVKTLALEGFRSAVSQIALRRRAALKRDLDQAGIAAVKAAQQVHRVGKVAAAMRAGRVEQAVEMRMARAAVTRTRASCASATLTGLGSTDRLIAILLPSAKLIGKAYRVVPNPRA